ncbi:MAG: exopolyphosphatase [Gammaproteobacteria bacterium]|nr:exopolyphosphatase [Gammaproteobacteria bacterium]
MTEQNSSNIFAAIDLGSNSFHLIIAKEINGQIQVIDKIKEMVRLASGIDDNCCLTEEIMDKALECLSIFGQRLVDIPSNNVRIVGTNTLRKAKNSQQFIIKAEESLNHPIEVIAGREEARLIYLGVAHGQPDQENKRLVMDIGGGSTEFIIGQGFEQNLTESLHMGCVSMTLQAFKNGKLSEKNFSRAILAAELELRSIRQEYLTSGWYDSIGASGSIKAVGQVLSEQFEQSYRGITIEGLMWLKQEMISQKRIEKLQLPGLSLDRTPIFVGGVAILIATFRMLQISLMTVSDSALREGLIFDMLGRKSPEDVRLRTIEHFKQQYHVSEAQANRVSDTAIKLFNYLKDCWHLEMEAQQEILWASSVHEVGLSIAHNQYHKHGAYILKYADMPGFSKAEQKRLAVLIRAQRGKFPLSELQEFSAHFYHHIIFQVIILRLAILFNRGRTDTKEFPEISVEASNDELTMLFPKGYFQEKPLTYADLKTEKKRLKAINFNLLIAESTL